MSNCLLCGMETKGGYFCKSSGHHRIYKMMLLRELSSGSISAEHLEHLRFFNWLPADVDLPFTDSVETQSTKRSRKKKVIGKPASFRKFGVELECTCPCFSESSILSEVNGMGYNMVHTKYTHVDTPHWKSLYDGSIRCELGHESKEFVSPAFEDESGLEEVSNICKIIIDNGGKTNRTTGTHIHLDASDLTPQEIAKIVYFYGKLENKLNAFLPDDRKHNKYCASVKRFCNYVSYSGFEYFDTVQKIIRILGTRYLKVNVEAYLRHGTIEFRQLNGTLDGDLVRYWVKLMTRIIDYVKAGNDVTQVRGSIFNILGCQEDEIEFWKGVKNSLIA